MSCQLRILYAGKLHRGATCRMRMEALLELGHDVMGIDTTPAALPRGTARLLKAARIRLGFPPDLTRANERLLEESRQREFDVLWVDAIQIVRPDTLETYSRIQSNSLRVAFIQDDPFSHVVPGWRRFHTCIPHYDVNFVIRDMNVGELRDAGAKHVEKFHKGFHYSLHRPVPVPNLFPRSDVLFIGRWEERREECLKLLAISGIDLRIIGLGRWKRGQHWRVLARCIETRGLFGEDYVRALCSAKIGLCFYSQWARDVENSRMYEIPACGTFMLAERNEENVHLFKEGKEAEFFSSGKELLDKTRYYLKHDDERKRIAAAGRERCLRSGYSYYDRMREVVERIKGILGQRR